MRILYVANGDFKHHGERAHCFSARIRNGLIRNGHHVYFLSDRDTAREAGIFRKWTGKTYVCNIFLKICKNFEPDMILLGQADYITLEALLTAKRLLPRVKIAAYTPDVVFYPHIEQTITSKAPALDAVFCTTAGEAIRKRFKRDGITVAYLPNPCDESIDYIRAEQKTGQEYDVFWAMRGVRPSYPGDPRYEIPRFLAKDPKIKLNAYGFDGKPILMGRNYYAAISDCKGGLNLSVSRLNEKPLEDPKDIYLYSSDRIGHYFGCGLLVYMARGFAWEEILKESEHAIYFNSAEELAEKVKYFSAHDDERIKIARSGAEFYRKHFNEREVSRYLVDVTFHGKPLSPLAIHTAIY